MPPRSYRRGERKGEKSGIRGGLYSGAAFEGCKDCAEVCGGGRCIDVRCGVWEKWGGFHQRADGGYDGVHTP